MNFEGSASVATFDKSWVISIRKRLEKQSHPVPWNSWNRVRPSIYRVPNVIRQVDVDAYEPKVLSIGPLHRGNPKLAAMEKHKWRYLHDLLSANPEFSLEKCLVEMKSLEEMARSSYSETIELDSNEFVEMMLLDGCFIVEFLIKLRESSLEFIFTSKEVEEPMFNTIWILTPIVHDILLLENQLPFFVLQRLFDLAFMLNRQRFVNHSLMEIAFFMCNCLVPLNEEINQLPACSIHHLLHLFHTHLIPSPKKPITHSYTYNLSSHLLALFNTHVHPVEPSKPAPPERRAKTIPSVTELQDAGVKFKKKVKKAGSFMELEFSKGVMQIPQLYIYPNTNAFFRNLIAFEQCYPNSRTYFTAYAMFMDSLIDTPNDVLLLKQQGIIHHGLGTDADLAFLYNQLSKGLNFYYSKTYLADVYLGVKSYYESNWHKWRASLVHDYFRNPWAFLSVMAAVVLLMLTIAQTVFSALSHFTNPSNAS